MGTPPVCYFALKCSHFGPGASRAAGDPQAEQGANGAAAPQWPFPLMPRDPGVGSLSVPRDPKSHTTKATALIFLLGPEGSRNQTRLLCPQNSLGIERVQSKWKFAVKVIFLHSPFPKVSLKQNNILWCVFYGSFLLFLLGIPGVVVEVDDDE